MGVPERTHARPRRGGGQGAPLRADLAHRPGDRRPAGARRRLAARDARRHEGRRMRLGPHGYVGRLRPRPAAEARALSQAIRIAEADFAIVNAEIEYERSPPEPRRSSSTRTGACGRGSRRTSRRLAARRSIRAPTRQSGPARGSAACLRPTRTLNPGALKPTQCLADWARFFERRTLRPTAGCFSEGGYRILRSRVWCRASAWYR